MTGELLGFLKEHYGLAGRIGGWIHRADGSPICQGYAELRRQVIERGIILRRHPFIDYEKAQKYLGSRPKKK